MSASGAAGEESSRALQDAEQEPPPRRGRVVVVSNPVELDSHDPPRPSYLVQHQYADAEPPQRRGVTPIILAADDERAHDTTAELVLHHAPRPSSNLVLQSADTEPLQRRGVALVSAPITLTAADERARALVADDDTDVELGLHDNAPRYLVMHPRIVAIDPGYFARQPSAYILAADRSGRLRFRVTNPGSNDCRK